MRISLQQPSNVGVKKRHRKILKNDDFKVSESILQIGRLAGRNGDDWVFNTKNSKMAF